MENFVGGNKGCEICQSVPACNRFGFWWQPFSSKLDFGYRHGWVVITKVLLQPQHNRVCNQNLKLLQRSCKFRFTFFATTLTTFSTAIQLLQFSFFFFNEYTFPLRFSVKIFFLNIFLLDNNFWRTYTLLGTKPNNFPNW